MRKADTPRHWRSRAAALVWSGSAIAFAALGCSLLYATSGDLTRFSRLVTPTPREVAADVIVRRATDETGRHASFRILLFSDEFRWRLSSHETLERERAPEFTPEMKTLLNTATEIICVGASSEEIPRGLTPDQGRRAEETRAARRAERIATWVRKATTRAIPIRKLNVGYHAPTTHARDTSDQRRVVIILVLEADSKTDIDEALRAAMMTERARAPVFETLLTRYSLSTGRSFTWVE